MPQVEHRALNVTDHQAANKDASPNLAQMAHNQEPMSKFTDSSGPLFTMFCKLTDGNKWVENWLKRIDNIVFFMTLSSTVIAALLSVTVPDLKQDPQDKSAFYLENIYKLQALSGSNVSLPSTLAQPPPFSAPTYAIWVNALLFISLCLNIFTVIMALHIQGFVPVYLLKIESLSRTPQYRARMSKIISSEWSSSPGGNMSLTFMVTFSWWFFFAGLSIYLFNINRAVFGPFISCICLCSILFIFVKIWLFRIPSRSNSSTEIDGRILYQLFNYLVVEDSDWMKFFECIPGFCKSSIVDDPLRWVTNLGKQQLRRAVTALLERTWSSSFLSDSEKIRRLVVCVNFSDVLRLPDVASSILRDIFPPDLHNAVEIGQFLRNQANRGQTKVGLCAQSIVAGIISKVQGSNERWVSLAADQLGKSEDVIRGYLEDGNDDNMLLANLTHITREIFHSLKENRDMAASSASILPSLSNFDIRNTLPELQNSFLALWNEIEQAPNDSVPTEIRDHLLNLHNALNQGTDDPVTTPSVSQTNTIIGTSLPVSYHGVTADAADELSPGGIPEAARRPTTPSRPTPALVSFGHSGTSHADASAAADAAITGNIANTQFGEQPTIRPDSSSVLPAMVTSTPSTTPEVASIFRPADAAPLISHHDAQDLGGPIEMTSLHRTRQSGTPAQNLDASDSPI